MHVIFAVYACDVYKMQNENDMNNVELMDESKEDRKTGICKTGHNTY